MSAPRTAALADHLRSRLGAAADPPPDLTVRLRTDAYAAVVAPPDADGVAAALALCSAEGWPVLAAGGATWLEAAGHAVQERAAVVISTARLRRVVEHEPADLVIGVEAGLPLPELCDVLAGQGQWLPLDPPAAAEATIGAVAALGAAGPLRAGHGTPRDLALGVQVATGDGRLLRFGGRVVKNVAGYDGVRLLVGSRGTLGIITSLYLRVRGTPRADRTLALGCGAGADGGRRGAELALAVRDAAPCDAIELVGPEVAARLSTGVAPGWTLLVRLTGGAAAVAEAVARVHAVAGAVLEASGEVWAGLSRLEADAGAAVRLAGPATSLAEGLAAAARIAGNAQSGREMSWLCAAHATEGVIRLWRPGPAVPPPAGIEGTGGWTVRYEGAPAGGASPEVAALTRRLRAAFDPAGILGGGGSRP